MEVSMSNVPPEFTDISLSRQLDPLIKALGIKHWRCSKARRKKFAQLLFLNESDGVTFTRRYGVVKTSLTTERAELRLLNTPIFCRVKKGEPDRWGLRSLQLQVEQESIRKDVQERTDEAVVFQLDEFACGNYAYRKGRLTFTPAVTWSCTGVAKFTHRFVTIELNGLARLQIPVYSIMEVISGTRQATLTLTLCESPVVSTREPSEAQLLQSLNLNGFSRRAPIWRRISSIPHDDTKLTQYSLVYSFQISYLSFAPGVQQLQQRDSLIITPYDLRWNSPDINLRADMLGLHSTLSDFTARNLLPFPVLFQLQKLVHNGYLPVNTVRALAKTLQALHNPDSTTTHSNVTRSTTSMRRPISAEAIKRTLPQIPFPGPDVDPKFFDVQNLLELLFKHEEELQSEQQTRASLIARSNNMVLVHHITISPTKITLHGPEWESKNRILRKYPNHHDYFVRVRFADENGESLFFDPRMDQDSIYDRFKKIMSNGIQITGRSFSFLGFSHSSLRSQSAWFSAPFYHDRKLHTNFNIIDALGEFSHITSPAKCAARIGQAFSETPIAIPLGEHNVKVSEIPDIESSDKKRVFSDGVGTISPELVDIINSEYLPNGKGYPTCFQIRYAGAKGMLSMNTRLKGKQICIRPSMIKFPGNDKSHLELCDTASEPKPLFLNRQIIKILEDMGVPETWFFKLQNQELDRLRHIMETGRTIAKFLKRQVGQSFGLGQLYRYIHELDMDFRQDTFLRSIVEIIVLQKLRLLKHKARIPVEHGVTLFGIVDETGFLKEDEVYVTFNNRESKKKSPGASRVLVTRSPALHPGDVQVAQLVNPPSHSPLAQLSNCIVFSQHGSRDLPSKLSGGDLDGDLYNIIWDREAVQPGIRLFEAADYPRTEAIDLGRPVERQDMIDFFVDFMKTDHLGVIATRHMISADQKDLGTLDRDCLILAERHSDAVDFSKSGKAVPLNTLPRVAPYRPDFLAAIPPVHIVNRREIDIDMKEPPLQCDSDGEYEGSTPRYQHYRSEKILGKLYRAIDEKKIWKKDIRMDEVKGDREGFNWMALVYTMSSLCAKRGIFWTHRLEEAQKIRATYEDYIFDAMYTYSDHPVKPLSEVEVFVGCVHNTRGAQTRRQRDSSDKLKEHVARIFSWVAKYIRQLEDSDTNSEDDSESEGQSNAKPARSEMGSSISSVELALACLHTACTPGSGNEHGENQGRGSSSEKLVSFRIVAAAVLRREMEVVMPGWTDTSSIKTRAAY